MIKYLLIITLLSVYVAYMFRAKSHMEGGASTIIGMLAASDASLLVDGWRKDELQKVLADFAATYSLDPDMFALETKGLQLRIKLNRDIVADQFLYLTNYIHYPKEFDLRSRQVAAVGTMSLSHLRGISPSPAQGERATVYMPHQDQDYDVAYVRRASGQTYRVSLTNMYWEPVADPRLPPHIRQTI